MLRARPSEYLLITWRYQVSACSRISKAILNCISLKSGWDFPLLCSKVLYIKTAQCSYATQIGVSFGSHRTCYRRNPVLLADVVSYRSASLLACKQVLLVICSHGREWALLRWGWKAWVWVAKSKGSISSFVLRTYIIGGMGWRSYILIDE